MLEYVTSYLTNGMLRSVTVSVKFKDRGARLKRRTGTVILPNGTPNIVWEEALRIIIGEISRWETELENDARIASNSRVLQRLVGPEEYNRLIKGL